MVTEGVSNLVAGASDSSAGSMFRFPGKSEDKTPKSMAEFLIVKVLVIFEFLVNASMLLNSPQAGVLLVAPKLGSTSQSSPSGQTAEAFVKSLQVTFRHLTTLALHSMSCCIGRVVHAIIHKPYSFAKINR
jgi:hypothetical protein